MHTQAKVKMTERLLKLTSSSLASSNRKKLISVNDAGKGNKNEQ
jgi:hypothetical protein